MSPVNCPYSNSIIEIMNSTATYTEPVNRIKQRILIDGNLENMACCCDDWSDFVIEISEWGIDHLGGVDFFDSYKSFRDFTFNPELDIQKLDAFISNQ